MQPCSCSMATAARVDLFFFLIFNLFLFYIFLLELAERINAIQKQKQIIKIPGDKWPFIFAALRRWCLQLTRTSEWCSAKVSAKRISVIKLWPFCERRDMMKNEMVSSAIFMTILPKRSRGMASKHCDTFALFLSLVWITFPHRTHEWTTTMNERAQGTWKWQNLWLHIIFFSRLLLSSLKEFLPFAGLSLPRMISYVDSVDD